MTSILSPRKRFLDSGRWNQYLAGALSSLSFGACSATYFWVNPVLTRLLAKDSPVPMGVVDSGLVAALPEIGSAISPILAGFLADKFGRRKILLATAPLQAISWLSMLAIADKRALFVVRFIQGLFLGGICTVLPLYLAEIADRNTRGRLGVMSSLGWNLGIVYEFATGPFVSYQQLHWINFAFPMIFLVMFYYFQESPTYLIMQGKKKEARIALASFRDKGSVTVDEELNEIEESIVAESKNDSSWKDLFTSKAGRRGMLVVIVINITFNMCGAMSILGFSTATFLDITHKHLDSNLFTLAMALVLSGIPIITALTIDRYGRKPTLIISYAGSTICLLPACIYYLCRQHGASLNETWGWVAVTGIVLYPTMINYGAMIVAHTYQAELFPASTRGLSSALSTIIGAAIASITLQLYEIMEHGGLNYVTYSIYTAFALAGLVFSFYCPETKGKTFDEIQADLSK